MAGGVSNIGNVFSVKKRITPTMALTLNSSPVLALAGTPSVFRLVIGGAAFVYTGATPYNESIMIMIRQGVGDAATSFGFTSNVLNSTIIAAINTNGANCAGADAINANNDLLISAGADLTGGDLGWDVTIYYVNVYIR